MHKRPLLFLLAFIFAISAHAQLTVGARAGYGMSASSFEIQKGMTRTLGTSPLLGAVLHYNLDLRFSVGMEINYYKFSEDIGYSEDYFPNFSTAAPKAVNSSLSLSYLQIPITGRASIGEKKYRGFVNLGPYIGFAMNGTWKNGPKVAYLSDKITPQYVTLDSTYSYDQGKTRKFDIGGIIGGGLEYQLGATDMLFLEGRIQLGFLDFYTLSDVERRGFSSGTEYLVPSASWRSFSISVGYLRTFKLPKFKSSSDPKKAGMQKKSS